MEETKKIPEKSEMPENTESKENDKVQESSKVHVSDDAQEKATEQKKPESKGTQQDSEKGKEDSKEPQKKKWIWIVMLVVVVLLGLLIAGYCKKAVYYQTHFFRNTSINNIDCSEMEATAVAAQLNSRIIEYNVEIIGRDEDGKEISLGTVYASDINYSYVDSSKAVEAILEQQNEWLWITTLGDEHRNHSLMQGVTYDEELLVEKVLALDSFQKKSMIAPTDAYISGYSEETGKYEIIPETLGTKFDVDRAVSCVEAAVTGDSAADGVTVNLVEQGCYEEPEITAENEKLVSQVETINQWLSAEITYDWNGNEVVVDNSVIKEWASLEDGKPVLDEQAIADFVNQNANAYDTYGKNATFTTTLGVQLSLPRLSYGWKTNREEEIARLTELIKTGSKQEREPAYWRKGVWKGQNDIGNSYIEADITHQHLYVYDKGVIVFETDFVSGDISKPDCVSPAGIFGLTYKTLNAVLRGADYETPVTYWMPFYGNFGMHDATWRDSFGGDIYLTNGSHGCLNLPFDAAAVIYNYVYEGSPIICYYY